MTKEKLEALRLPELRALFAKVTGEETSCPNKVFLVRRILEAQKEQRKVKRAATADAPGKPVKRDLKRPSAASKTSKAAPDIEELQARYEKAVGRPTGSVDAAYLKWKIRMAEKGHIRVGPVRRAQPGVVLALRLPAPAIRALDGAWRREGLKSRLAAIRAALKAYLAGLGEAEAAASLG